MSGPEYPPDELPSDDEEVDRTITTVHEACACGSVYELSMPSAYRGTLLKGVNTWRKYHACSIRGD